MGEVVSSKCDLAVGVLVGCDRLGDFIASEQADLVEAVKVPAGCLVDAAEHERLAAGELSGPLLELVEAASDHGDRLVVKVAVGARPGGEAPLAAIPRVPGLVGDEEPGDGRAACEWLSFFVSKTEMREYGDNRSIIYLRK